MKKPPNKEILSKKPTIKSCQFTTEVNFSNAMFVKKCLNPKNIKTSITKKSTVKNLNFKQMNKQWFNFKHCFSIIKWRHWLKMLGNNQLCLFLNLQYNLQNLYQEENSMWWSIKWLNLYKQSKPNQGSLQCR